MEKTNARTWLVLILIAIIAIICVYIIKNFEGMTNITDATLI